MSRQTKLIIAFIVIASFALGAITTSISQLHRSVSAERRIQRVPGQSGGPRQGDTPRAGVPRLAQDFLSNPQPASATERENRDLAAQEASAAWAFWMVPISAAGLILGSITTFAAIAAAIYARDTVKAARSSFLQTEEATFSEHRAWLDFQITDARPFFRDEISVMPRINVQNLGRTPADMAFCLPVVVPHGVDFKLPDLTQDLEALDQRFRSIPNIRGATIFPGQSIEMEYPAEFKNPEVLAHYRSTPGGVWLTLAIRVSYRTRGRVRHTDHYFQIGGEKWGVLDRQKHLDPNTAVQEYSVVEKSGGEIV